MESQPKKKRSGAYSRRKGNKYELKIIKELIDIGYPGLVSSRSESKSLDNDKIDIADPENVLPFYVQCKCTKVYPKYSEIIDVCPRKDKPLVIFHNKQINKTTNMASAGEFIIMLDSFFLTIINKDINIQYIEKKTKNTPSYDKLLDTEDKVLKHTKDNFNYIIINKSLFYKLVKK